MQMWGDNRQVSYIVCVWVILTTNHPFSEYYTQLMDAHIPCRGSHSIIHDRRKINVKELRNNGMREQAIVLCPSNHSNPSLNRVHHIHQLCYPLYCLSFSLHSISSLFHSLFHLSHPPMLINSQAVVNWPTSSGSIPCSHSVNHPSLPSTVPISISFSVSTHKANVKRKKEQQREQKYSRTIVTVTQPQMISRGRQWKKRLKEVCPAYMFSPPFAISLSLFLPLHPLLSPSRPLHCFLCQWPFSNNRSVPLFIPSCCLVPFFLLSMYYLLQWYSTHDKYKLRKRRSISPR